MEYLEYGKPLIVGDGAVSRFSRLSDTNDSGRAVYDERFIQRLVFKHPETLPVSDVDDAYVPIVPICTELNTPAGPIDAIFATPNGRLVIVETKLWRNPEARRKVVAQILDYAKELAQWDYEDLQREINRRLSSEGNTLYRLVTAAPGEQGIDEAAFVDAVSRALKKGRFMLMIVGDGIREGAAGIAEFLDTVGHLEFTFGLVELKIYTNAELGTLVYPHVIARTVELRRVVISVPEGFEFSLSPSDVDSPTQTNPDLDEMRRYYQQFWSEFLQELRLDDPAQARPNLPKSTNIFFHLPTKNAWVSAYFSRSTQVVGVYFSCSNNQSGRDIASFIMDAREEVVSQLGSDVHWNFTDQGGHIGVHRSFEDVHSAAHRDEIKKFFQKWVNRYINVFRPLMKRFEREDH